MEIEYLDEITEIGDAFIKRFVLSWESFQIKHKDWIEEMSKQDYPIDKQWYDQAYMWDKMDSTYPGASMKEALDYLREHPGIVYFMTEKGEGQYFQGTKTIDFIAKTDAYQLAERIEYEWNESYRVVSQNMYLPDALPDDLYVFDSTMKWCVVFTHETTDWEAEKADDGMKVVQSRYCIICKEQ
ncbi:MAG: hypothetical protein J5874_03550 [Oscillospiraceae bacterium]|nr:hypothetical protein [Oscillospiraceae bacterium]